MRAENLDLIVWIDTETTGLDPVHDLLLEIAVVVTDNDLTELGASAVVIAPEHGPTDAVARMDRFVVDMHTANGLVEDIAAPAALPVQRADAAIASTIDTLTEGAEGPFILGGNSITHDRAFLAQQAPLTFSRLHYRSMDVSSIEQDLRRDGFADQVAAWRASATPSGGHRALGDIRDSIRQLASLREIRKSELANA